MKYRRWYDQIIDRARGRKLDDYKERHHIIPRAFGGSDDPANLVDLTYREHFLVHWLLTKTSDGYQQRQMLYALHCMTMEITGTKRIVAAWQYDLVKRAMKRMVLKMRDRRKAQIRVARLAKAKEIEEVAAHAAVAVTNLRLAGGPRTRHTVSELANDWIRADPRRLRWLRRRRIRDNSYPPPPLNRKTRAAGP